MDLLSWINLAHWLMIAGAILVAMGFLGLVFTRNRQAATNPVRTNCTTLPDAAAAKIAQFFAPQGQRMTVQEYSPRLVEPGLKASPKPDLRRC